MDEESHFEGSSQEVREPKEEIVLNAVSLLYPNPKTSIKDSPCAITMRNLSYILHTMANGMTVIMLYMTLARCI